jgi:hypothetical protein
MVKSEQQRQKKLAKKRSKDIRNRRQLAQQRQTMNSLAGQMQWASSAPIHSCFISDSIFDKTGMGVIFFTRQVSDGRIAMMFLLIDAHCLGVKDVGGRLCTPKEFEQVFERSQHKSTFTAAAPSRARKITEEAIAYAQSLGFAPHPDYRKVAPLWADVDATQCTETFQFGLDGKPSYFAGPHDDQGRQNLIYRKLRDSVGEGNFHFTTSDEAFHTLDIDDLEARFIDSEDDDDDQLFLDGPEPSWDEESR